ncbi:ATP-binding protein [Fluviibacterium sp. DFM31]|uniref:histidine kinase n=1 Tax=Meridianimarinicoccus marinus TaxID=3231483 RepID=A0ABV3L7H3_9RHOB
MKPKSLTRIVIFVLFLLGGAATGLSVWWLSYEAALRGVAERGEADLALASGRFIGQLQRFQELAVLISDHPTLAARLRAGDAASSELSADAGALLLSVADKTGVYNIILLDQLGRIQAAAHPQAAARIDHVDQSYFQRAMSGALGTYHSVLPGESRRSFSVAAPVHGVGGPPLGAVVVVADIESTEAEWRGDAPVVMFRDELGVVFLSSRSELVLTRDLSVPLPRALSASYDPDHLKPFPDYRSRMVGEFEVWNINSGPYVPETAIHISKDLPVIGFVAEGLANAAPARRLALLQALLAVGLYVTAFALGLYLLNRRRRINKRLSDQAAAQEMLERRVAERTVELSRTNRALRSEVDDRIRVEEELRRTQASLVQAGKLSALGEMSAGISHELNQPLMAIQTFAENGTQFIEMGKTEVAAANLGKISELARRMGRIIKNLRAFARQEDAPLSNVDPVAVVDAALEISAARLARAGVEVLWQPPEQTFIVRAGSVRLQQVVMNLVSNAADAMEGQPDKRLEITIAPEGDAQVVVAVRDTGPGLDQPEKIFDPFYSTKSVAQDSMGLGLSISYGLVQSFGGDIEGENHPDGGAIFTVRLPRVAERSAA